jgi:hypothetical protein
MKTSGCSEYLDHKVRRRLLTIQMVDLPLATLKPNKTAIYNALVTQPCVNPYWQMLGMRAEFGGQNY